MTAFTIHTTLIVCLVLAAGLTVAGLLTKFTEWYDDRPERKRMREIIREAEERKR